MELKRFVLCNVCLALLVALPHGVGAQNGEKDRFSDVVRVQTEEAHEAVQVGPDEVGGLLDKWFEAVKTIVVKSKKTGERFGGGSDTKLFVYVDKDKYDAAVAASAEIKEIAPRLAGFLAAELEKVGTPGGQWTADTVRLGARLVRWTTLYQTLREWATWRPMLHYDTLELLDEEQTPILPEVPSTIPLIHPVAASGQSMKAGLDNLGDLIRELRGEMERALVEAGKGRQYLEQNRPDLVRPEYPYEKELRQALVYRDLDRYESAKEHVICLGFHLARAKASMNALAVTLDALRGKVDPSLRATEWHALVSNFRAIAVWAGGVYILNQGISSTFSHLDKYPGFGRRHRILEHKHLYEMFLVGAHGDASGAMHQLIKGKAKSKKKDSGGDAAAALFIGYSLSQWAGS